MGRMHEKQMTLGQIIDVLERKDPKALVRFDFAHFAPTGSVHSYRGFYEDLALDYDAGGDCTVGKLLAELKRADGRTFTGWKGGDFTMDRDTVVWVAQDRESGGTAIMDVRDDSWCIRFVTTCVD